jgi:hypothetical protein
MSLYNTFASDEKSEKDGIILDLGVNSKDQPIGIRIRRAGGSNTRFAKVFEQKSKPYRRLMEIPGALDPKVQERVMREVYADSVVVGWENVEDKDGTPMEFNRDNVIRLFTDLPNLFRLVMRESQNEALFRAEIREQEAGN